VALRLYDTRARGVREFTPLTPGVVTVYVCGPTVQAPPHIGHARAAISFDILRRWLLASGYDVVFASNVTDIDDKIIHSAGHDGVPWWSLAERNTRAFRAAYDALGVLPPTVEPHATGHVPEMIVLMQRLIDAGHAYAADGDVWFDVRSDPAYGEISNQRPDAMLASEAATAGKRDPLDFALWKSAKPDEPSWDTPWGPGRPGWHLECSAMATKYLGATFDIHGGGLDLVFPHHENEAAQSRCAGDGFARWWMHNGLVNVGAEKMSKSLGNSLVVADVLTRVRAPVLRYFLGSPHYRSMLDWSDDGLAEAAAAYGRIETFLRNAGPALAASGAEVPAAEEPAAAYAEFSEALDDDLAVPRALAAVHAAVRAGNSALSAQQPAVVAGWATVVGQMMTVLGFGEFLAGDDGGDLVPVVDGLVSVVLEQREAARARKDFAAADAIRDALVATGVTVEDTPDGPRWTVTAR
jgi:cysteinyl-tRNA synthetase